MYQHFTDEGKNHIWLHSIFGILCPYLCPVVFSIPRGVVQALTTLTKWLSGIPFFFLLNGPSAALLICLPSTCAIGGMLVHMCSFVHWMVSVISGQ